MVPFVPRIVHVIVQFSVVSLKAILVRAATPLPAIRWRRSAPRTPCGLYPGWHPVPDPGAARCGPSNIRAQQLSYTPRCGYSSNALSPLALASTG